MGIARCYRSTPKDRPVNAPPDFNAELLAVMREGGSATRLNLAGKPPALPGAVWP